MGKKYLITYRCEKTIPYSLVDPKRIGENIVIYGYSIADDPIEWIESVQEHGDETYILLNAQPMTPEQYTKYDGMFKGM